MPKITLIFDFLKEKIDKLLIFLNKNLKITLITSYFSIKIVKIIIVTIPVIKKTYNK